ncbi:ABC transporter substrate-binding protein [Nonomuraea africana]|uniref:Multiple sugar transport system substrate-binding protein n=1 Tax=Nonomuraea africana TaxID=46171 RepID=A0ABR9KH71_9ACTN|nr:sugar ABC transporter substrate-binding protein [Nonomuraea africana]MBE1561362.1 multiple sugar transport system substrate-binding protein [Nonomuraea africana]
MGKSKTILGAAGAMACVSLVAACGGQSGSQTSAAPSASAASGAAAGGPVTIEWWGWAPGYEDAAKAWNASHPDVQVKFTQTQPGSQGGYQRMLAAVKAGNAPCLAQVGAETLPSFLVEGALEDITAHAQPYNAKFQPWTLNTVTFGGQQFGIPVDSGPMGMFYRKDLFDQHGIEVPKTWDEYAAAAEKLRKADPEVSITTFTPDDMYGFAGFAQQAGAKWFGISGDAWQVKMNDAASVKVADYWQGLIDKELVDVMPGWSDGLWKNYTDGKSATLVGAVWMTKVLEDSISKTSGKWAVAPMPVWDAASPTVGNVGGSPNAVLKGCKNPKEAVDFAAWLSTDATAFNDLIDKGGLFPVTVDGGSLPNMSGARPFYGDQKVFEVFAEASKHVSPDFSWGPTMPAVNTVFAEEFAKAANGKGGTLAEALATIQEKAVASLKDKGLTVAP